MGVPEIRAEDLKQRLDAGENLFLLDVRDEFEFETSNIGGHLIPLAELPRRLNELDASQKIIAVCKMGPRGAKAVQVLHKAGFDQVWNLTGGIHAWSDRVDHARHHRISPGQAGAGYWHWRPKIEQWSRDPYIPRAGR